MACKYVAIIGICSTDPIYRFLWAGLQVDALCRLNREEDVQTGATDLTMPLLSSMYERTMESIQAKGERSSSTALRLFAWLVHGKELLSTEALLKSFSDYANIPSEVEVLSAACSLVIKDHHRNIFRFAHVTIYEYIVSLPEFASAHLESNLTRSCMAICESDAGLSEDTSESMKGIRRYAILYWAYHAHEHEAVASTPDEVQYINEFCFVEQEPSLTFLQWLGDAKDVVGELPITHPLQSLWSIFEPETLSLISMSCIYGLVTIMRKALSSRHTNINSQNSYGQTPLYIASFSGHATVVQLLLASGARHDIRGGRHAFPLHVACFRGHGQIVRDLLAAGADHQTSNDIGDALTNAFETHNEDMALLFFPQYVSVNEKTQFDALYAKAAHAGMPKILARLEELYPQFRDSASAINKALLSACRRGQTNVVDRFVKSYHDKSPGLLGPALVTASLHGQDRVVQILADAGAPLLYEDDMGSAIRCAALAGYSETVKLLLRLGKTSGIELQVQDAVKAAASHGHDLALNVLIEHGTFEDFAKDPFVGALKVAAFGGHATVVALLLGHQPSMCDAEDLAQVVGAAAAGTRYDILQLLLDRGMDIVEEIKSSRPMFKLGGRRNNFRQPLQLLAKYGLGDKASPTRHCLGRAELSGPVATPQKFAE